MIFFVGRGGDGDGAGDDGDGPSDFNNHHSILNTEYIQERIINNQIISW